MIKKILIISILTVSIVISSLVIQQRKAEAVIPLIGYVAISALVHFALGAYIYLKNKDTGNTEMLEVGNINSNTGEIAFEVVLDTAGNEISDIETGTSGAHPLKIYDRSSLPSNLISTPSNNIWGSSLNSSNGSDDPVARAALRAECINSPDPYLDFCEFDMDQTDYRVNGWKYSDSGTAFLDPMAEQFPPLDYDANAGAVGGAYTGSINGNEVEIFESSEDLPPPPETCVDGIQNQDETDIDCGGVCPECPPSCNDEIMNQDETGIDYGGVCGTDDPVAAPAENFTDTNQDGVDDLSGLDSTGSITVASPGDADGSTYDSSLPGDISEVGETDWSGLITGYLATNPLVLLATGSSINLAGEECTLTANVFATDIVLDFCSVEGLIDLIGTFVLGLMAIRSVFIAMGI